LPPSGKSLGKNERNDEVTLTTSESVIAEVVFILSSKRLYNLSCQDVYIRLYPPADVHVAGCT
jgi:hypothetical protein